MKSSSTHYSGRLDFDLDPFYVKILRTYSNYTFDVNTIFINPDFIELQCWESDKILFLDVFKYIEKFGKIYNCFVSFSFGLKNLHIIKDIDGFLYECHYLIEQNKGYERDVQDLYQRFSNFQFNKYTIKTNERVQYFQPYDRLDYYISLLDLFMKEKKIENLKKVVNEIKNKNIVIEFICDGEILCIDGSHNYRVNPIVEQYTPRKLVPHYARLSSYEIDKNDERLIDIDGNFVYCHEIFMKMIIDDRRDNEQSVILPDSTTSKVCDQCIFRMRKITSGCDRCLPEKTKKRK